ncbi:MAG TPA: amidohydrolase family protein [Planctomycetota bacterium]|nr:amidohydrolase family protein [Planctomycetota bacterium]
MHAAGFAAILALTQIAQAPTPPAVTDDLVAVKVGRVITVSGEEIPDGIIIIERGRIRAVGKDVQVPWNARVYSFPRGTALPGLIAAHTTLGLRVPNENVPNVAYITVLDGIDPSIGAFKSALRDGVTVAGVMPANVTRIGGQGAVVRTFGRTIDDLVIRSPSGIKISLRPPAGETRMQNAAQLRKTFLDLYSKVRDVALEASPPATLTGKPEVEENLTTVLTARPPWKEIAWDKVPLEKVQLELQPLVDLVRGKLPAFIYCPLASDVLKAFEVMDSNGLQATLVLGPDGYKAATAIQARAGLGPVVLDGELIHWETDPDTGEERRTVTPRVFHDAGIRFALQTSLDARDNSARFSRDGESHLWYQAAVLVRHGIPRGDALRSVTLTPAEILGLAGRMGSIEVGKDGNIAIFSGDPLDARSWVEVVLIEGKEAYLKTKDRDLEALLGPQERPF